MQPSYCQQGLNVNKQSKNDEKMLTSFSDANYL